MMIAQFAVSPWKQHSAYLAPTCFTTLVCVPGMYVDLLRDLLLKGRAAGLSNTILAPLVVHRSSREDKKRTARINGTSSSTVQDRHADEKHVFSPLVTFENSPSSFRR